MEKYQTDILSRIRAFKKDHFYNCGLCRDSGMIGNDVDGYRLCNCRKKEIALTRMKNNGLEPGQMTFDNFDLKTEVARAMAKTARTYIKNYPDGSMAMLGQVGAGKTHIIRATMEALINRGIDVQYRSYADLMAILRQNRFDEEGYRKQMTQLKHCGVLVIDDLFKGIRLPLSEWDKRDISVIFEIINNRYLNNKKPLIVSSEFGIKTMIDIDEALGTRIEEMTRRYRIVIDKDPKKNRRLYAE